MVDDPHRLIDIDAVTLPAFGLADDRDAFDTEWHAHRQHQLLYALSGTLELRIVDTRWLLPPQRAAWINRHTEHRVIAKTPVQLRTIYFADDYVQEDRDACRVFAVTPLAREMVLRAMAWGPTLEALDELGEAFFAALALLCAEWAEHPVPCRLPVAQSRELERAMAYTIEHLAHALRIEDVARAAAVSPRSLRRRFREETRGSWSQFLRDVRMMRATELLADPNLSVTEVALGVGYDSPSAFTRAFEAFVGEKPSSFRRLAQCGK